MSVSNFSDLYPYVRTLLGDTFSVSTYSNAQLDMGVALALLQEAPFLDNGDLTISPSVSTAADKLRISVRSALALLRPTADEGGYRTPMLSVNSKASISYSDLKSLLSELVNGGLNIVLGDNEFDQCFNGITTVPALLARFGVTQGVIGNYGAGVQSSYPNG